MVHYTEVGNLEAMRGWGWAEWMGVWLGGWVGGWVGGFDIKGWWVVSKDVKSFQQFLKVSVNAMMTSHIIRAQI